MSPRRRRRHSFAALMQSAVLNASAATPWYLAGGIAAANCLAAFQPKGAASLAASYVNLATSGATWDCTAPVAAPTFAAATGWTFTGTQYLLVGSAAIATATPLTMICLFKPTDITTNNFLMAIVRTNTAINLFAVSANGSASGDVVQAQVWQAGTPAVAETSAGFSASVWQTLAGTYTSATGRAVYLDGGNKGTGVDNITPASLNATMIGGYHDSSAYVPLARGIVGACAFYNIVASDAQVLSLHTAMRALVP
jgi:hypothetical protein